MNLKDSEIVLALANIASQGTYTVKPQQAREMNDVFVLAARLVNKLEAQERADAAIPTEVPNDNTE